MESTNTKVKKTKGILAIEKKIGRPIEKDINELRAKGFMVAEIAKKYGVTLDVLKYNLKVLKRGGYLKPYQKPNPPNLDYISTVEFPGRNKTIKHFSKGNKRKAEELVKTATLYWIAEKTNIVYIYSPTLTPDAEEKIQGKVRDNKYKTLGQVVDEISKMIEVPSF